MSEPNSKRFHVGLVRDRRLLRFTVDQLAPGGDYPGRYDGSLLSFDSRGKLFVRKENTREYLDIETDGLWGLFRRNKPTGGSFKINKNGHVLIAIKDAKGWRRQFLGHAKAYNLVNYISEDDAK